MAGKRLIKWLAKIFAVLAASGVVGLTTLFFLLWQEHKTEMALPEPTGSFTVGRTTYSWVNNSETDELAPSAGEKKEIAGWIWYPAVAGSAAPSEYLPAAWRLALEQHSGVLMSQFLTRDLSRVRSHSTSDPNVSTAQRTYPVVIMRAGGGALTTDFTTLAENLASHGYIVVGFDAPYRSFVFISHDNRVIARPSTNDPENLPADQRERLINRLLPMWISDTNFVLSKLQELNASDPTRKFTGRMDLQQLGFFGHSFGGATALQFCHDDSQCKAGIDIDGAPYGSVVQEGLKQPFMFILSDHSRDMSDPAAKQIMANIQSIYGRLSGGRLLFTIRGANHFSFSDQILLKSHYVTGTLQRLGFGRLDGRRGLGITAEYVHTFFDVYLKGAPAAQLQSLSQRYPEVQAEPSMN